MNISNSLEKFRAKISKKKEAEKAEDNVSYPKRVKRGELGIAYREDDKYILYCFQFSLVTT